MVDDWVQDMYEEHGVILRVASLLEKLVEKTRCENAVQGKIVDDFLVVITNFADKCHHGKEEKVLFPLLAGKGKESARIVDELLVEHWQGRAFVGLMRKGGGKNIEKGPKAIPILSGRTLKKKQCFFWKRTRA